MARRSTYKNRKVKKTWFNTKGLKDTEVTRLKEPDDPDHKMFKVVHSLKAWAQVQVLIDHYNEEGNEVSWFTPVIVDEEARTLTIPEIFVPEQEVDGVETDAPDLDLVVHDALAAGYGLDTLRGWFHLHPNGLTVTPSGQDEAQVQEYLENGYPNLLRGIINDSGDIKLDYYDTEANVVYNNMKNSVLWGEAPGEPCKILAVAAERVTEAVRTVGYATGGYAYGYSPRPQVGTVGNTGNVAKFNQPVTGEEARPNHAGLYIIKELADGNYLCAYGNSLKTSGEDAPTYLYETAKQRTVYNNMTILEIMERFGDDAIDEELVLDALDNMGVHITDAYALIPRILGFQPMQEEEADDKASA